MTVMRRGEPVAQLECLAWNSYLETATDVGDEDVTTDGVAVGTRVASMLYPATSSESSTA